MLGRVDAQVEVMTVERKESNGAPAKVNRRAMLRGASAAVPAILTLHSGAALARSSNLISTSKYVGEQGGKYRCLDFDGIGGTEQPNVFDLGNPAMGHVTRIDADSRYYSSDPNRYTWGGYPQEVSKQKMCADGGTYYRKDRYRTREVKVKRGVLVSATALSSFSSGINYTDV
jgi:hypothetical protein